MKSPEAKDISESIVFAVENSRGLEAAGFESTFQVAYDNMAVAVFDPLGGDAAMVPGVKRKQLHEKLVTCEKAASSSFSANCRR